MNKILLIALGFIISNSFIATSMALATQEDIENACYDKADEKKVPEDKYDEFVAKCIADAEAKSGK